jgi:hypothetical protein
MEFEAVRARLREREIIDTMGFLGTRILSFKIVSFSLLL